ncbi:MULTISPECIES: ABC transporter permease [unclassified Plantibacter]|uniref:ABC transporter permease n=1 Tax=unclassified Plantibacter TaxID=2624265 RepID=UPI0012FBCBB1|nr:MULTISPECIES: ABC transporter permease [unclassified Plantibacter]
MRGITGNLTRSILTIVMIVIGVGSVITLVAVGNGASKQVNDQIAALGASAITVSPGFSSTGTGASLQPEDADAIRSSRAATSISSVAPQVSAEKRAVAGSRSVSITVVGTTDAYFTITNAVIAQGRALSASDAIGGGDVTVLDAKSASALFPDGSAVGQTVLVGSTPLRVVGVLADGGAAQQMFGSGRTIYAPIDRVRASITGYGSLSALSVGAVSPAAVGQASAEVRAVLALRHGSVAFDLSTPDQLRSVLGGSATSLNGMLAGVAAISLLVGGIGVTNVMLLTVRERTREIGIRKALGARPLPIAGQFMIEATTLSIVGGALGVGAAFLVTRVPINGIPPVIEPTMVLLAAGLSIGIGIVFGTYPAVRASRMDPVQALRVGV